MEQDLRKRVKDSASRGGGGGGGGGLLPFQSFPESRRWPLGGTQVGASFQVCWFEERSRHEQAYGWCIHRD